MADDDRRREQLLIEAELARKQDELEALMELRGEGFTPRNSLVRTPPSGFGITPRADQEDGAVKRMLSSPEEVQEAVRRKVSGRRTVPPVAGITSGATQQPTKPAPQPRQVTEAPVSEVQEDTLAAMSELQLLDMAYKGVKAIGSVCFGTNKLNTADRGVVTTSNAEILAVVAALQIRLASRSQELSAEKLRCAQLELQLSQQSAVQPHQGTPAQVTSGPLSFANILKRPKGTTPMAVEPKGPAVLVYPVSDTIKSSEETKKTLQNAVKPGTEGIRIQSVRKVGSSGVVVRTATAEAANKLKSVMPAGLKVVEPKTRQPRVALRYLRAAATAEEIVDDLHKINMAEDSEWTLEKVKANCKVALIKPKFLVILECSMPLRDKLVRLGRVYIGWDEAEVSDHIRVTCCTKCQQYGHPEKYCRSKEMVCGKCGETGHRNTECKSLTNCCATCKRFKRKEAQTHHTAAAGCPARQFAEQQTVNMIQYG